MPFGFSGFSRRGVTARDRNIEGWVAFSALGKTPIYGLQVRAEGTLELDGHVVPDKTIGYVLAANMQPPQHLSGALLVQFDSVDEPLPVDHATEIEFYLPPQ